MDNKSNEAMLKNIKAIDKTMPQLGTIFCLKEHAMAIILQSMGCL